MLANKCHGAFVQCMRKEKKRNKTGFSQKVIMASLVTTCVVFYMLMHDTCAIMPV